MAGVAPVSPSFQFFDSSGNPLVSGKLYIYLAGTTTPTNTWADKTQLTLNTNPIILNAAGRCTMWLDDTLTYKFELQNSLGVVQPGYPVDNVPGSSAASSLVTFLQSGSGAVSRTAQSKMRDIIDLRDFGCVAGSGNDYTTEINNAVAQALANFGILRVPKGDWHTRGITDGHGVLFKGEGAGVSRLRHINGNATPLLSVLGGDTGQTAYPYYGFEGLTLLAANSTTALIRFEGRIDNLAKFDDLEFNAASAVGTTCHGLSIRDYLNLNMSRIRWDYIFGYGIEVRSANVFSGGHLHIDDFSYDNGQPTADRGLGLLYIDSTGYAGRKGVINLSNGRIEVNTKLTSVKPARALFRLLQESTAISSGASQFMLNFDNVAMEVATTAKDMKLASTNVGRISISQHNSSLYGFNELFGNDVYSDFGYPVSPVQTHRISGKSRDYSSDQVVRGEGRIIDGMMEYIVSSDGNFNQGGPLKRGDVAYHTSPTNSGGVSSGGRPFAFKAIQSRNGYCAPSASNLSGTGTINSASSSLVMSTTISNGASPGVAVDIPGAGVAGATLQAIIRSVDYDTNTITLDTNASTSVAGVTVAFAVAQVMAVDMVTFSAGVPTTGTFAVGDEVSNTGFNGTTNPVKQWACTVAGTPGTFRSTKFAVRLSTTANRPTLTASDVGVMYLDTTLAAAGKPIWWTGAAWVDATGATV
jgi:hypothetical protein